MRSMTFVLVLLAGLLASPNPVTASQCPDCKKEMEDLAEAQKRLTIARDAVSDALVQLGIMKLEWNGLITEAREELRKPESPASLAAWERLRAAAQTLGDQIKQLEQSQIPFLESMVQIEAVRVAVAEAALASCRAECAKPTTPTGVTTGSVGTSTATTTTCQPCTKAAEDAAKTQAELDAIKSTLENIDSNQKTLTAAMQGAIASGNVQLQTTIQGQLFRLGQAKAKADLEAESKSKELAPLLKQLDECEKQCKTSQWFRSKWPYFAAAGAGGAAALAGGGNNPTETINTPGAPQQQTLTTPQTPPQTPQTPARRPAAQHTVSGCVCNNNSANLDGTLQLCQRLGQIRTAGSGNTITIGGDAPLPTFQGTFSETTGEFELRTTTMVGTVTSNVVIAGTVELNGNIHNLRVSFGGTSGQQTLYTLTVVAVQ